MDVHKQIHNGASLLAGRLCAEIKAYPFYRGILCVNAVINALGQQEDVAGGERDLPVFQGEGDDLPAGQDTVKFNGIIKFILIKVIIILNLGI